MAGRSSQNAPAGNRDPRQARLRRALICLLASFALLVAAYMAVDYFPKSELGRSLNAHLDLLADPQSWVP